MMVLEAMKMETSVTAHNVGKARKLNVVTGDPVRLLQVLAELE